MPSLTHCIYASAATRGFEPSELAELLQKARQNNGRLGLTGMLLYVEGSFFQVLEGPSDIVDAMYDKLVLDPRHDHVTRIISEPIHKRAFSEWTMGFSNVSQQEISDISGINDFFGDGECFAELDAGRAKKLLAAFSEGRWRKKLGVRQPVGA